MTGDIVAIHLTAAAGAPMTSVPDAVATAGAGLEGDRYRTGDGFYSTVPGTGRQLTLIEAEALDAIAAETGIRLDPGDSRRNVTTRGVDLNDLVGRRFAIGAVVCRGVRRCEPCRRLEELTGQPVMGPLIGRGGLRAEVLVSGTIRVGDPVRPLADD